ncbi:MAG TPA: PIG-L deacetylase family protein [Candidatus Limnocylindrales bacterium]
MIRLELDGPDRGPLRLLLVGAHADDIEIGCGGTLLRLAGANRIRSVRWVVLSAEGSRLAEARAAVERFLPGVTDIDIDIEGFRDGYFPAQFGAIKDRVEALKDGPRPDVVFVPHREDRHQDHRLVADLAWNAFRDHLILEYEIPKWDGELGQPNFYVELAAGIVDTKSRLLREVFGSQADRHWFSDETFRGLARLRGIECRAAEGYAEGFHARKLVW